MIGGTSFSFGLSRSRLSAIDKISLFGPCGASVKLPASESPNSLLAFRAEYVFPESQISSFSFGLSGGLAPVGSLSIGIL